MTVDALAHCMLDHTDVYTMCGQWVDMSTAPDEPTKTITCIACTWCMSQGNYAGWKPRYR